MDSIIELAKQLGEIDKADCGDAKFYLESKTYDGSLWKTELDPNLIRFEKLKEMIGLMIEKYGFSFVFEAMNAYVQDMKTNELHKCKPANDFFYGKTRK